MPTLRHFRPRRAQTLEEARALGRAWAEHEAGDPASLKGNPAERAEFFYFFEEAAAFVDADAAPLNAELVGVVGDAACERWRELADDGSFAWASAEDRLS